MYGTVARLRAKPGTEQILRKLGDDMAADGSQRPSGLVAQSIYRLDAEPDVYYLAVAFASKDAYVANAGSAAQHERYLKLRELLVDDPEWHDGEIVFSSAAP